MSYRIEVAPRALDQLGRLDVEGRRRVQGALELLAEQPRPGRAEQILGGSGDWRVRTGGLRLVYAIDDDRETVRLVAIGRPVRAIPRAPRLTVPPPTPPGRARPVAASPQPPPQEPPPAAPLSDVHGADEGAPDEDGSPQGRGWFRRRAGHGTADGRRT